MASRTAAPKEPMRPKFAVTTRVTVELDLIVRLENGANCTFDTVAHVASGLGRAFVTEAIRRTAETEEWSSSHKLVGSPSVEVVSVTGEWKASKADIVEHAEGTSD